jgi:membrane dipeptidase
MTAVHPVIDGHNDYPWMVRELRLDPDFTADLTGEGLHTDLPRLRAGGVAAQYWSVYVPCGDPEPVATVKVLQQIDFVHRLVKRHPDHLALAMTADEVERARESGRVASLLGAEGGHCISSSLPVLRMLYSLGVRYMTLTHSANNPWADSATDAPGVGGLSPFGHDVVREMNRLGMQVDLSHVAPSTMHAALDTSVAPAFFSHSSARALCDHPRNVPDDVLVRVRDGGGVVMVTFVPFFLNEPCRAWSVEMYTMLETVEAPENSPQWRAKRSSWIAANPCPPSTIADVADHVEHVREVAGVDAVGLGGDYDGVFALPEGLDDVSKYPALLAELAGRGWSDAELTKLTWHNALRVLRATEDAADKAK